MAKREMLNNPSVQKRQQIGRLNECGQNVFDSVELSSASASSSLRGWLLTNSERRASCIGSAAELSELEATDTGLEFLEESNELISEGNVSLMRCGVYWGAVR